MPGCRRAPRLSGATRVSCPWWRWTWVRYGASSDGAVAVPWPDTLACEPGNERLDAEAAAPAAPPNAAILGEGFCTLRVHAGPEWVPPPPPVVVVPVWMGGDAGGVAIPLFGARFLVACLAVSGARLGLCHSAGNDDARIAPSGGGSALAAKELVGLELAGDRDSIEAPATCTGQTSRVSQRRARWLQPQVRTENSRRCSR